MASALCKLLGKVWQLAPLAALQFQHTSATHVLRHFSHASNISHLSGNLPSSGSCFKPFVTWHLSCRIKEKEWQQHTHIFTPSTHSVSVYWGPDTRTARWGRDRALHCAQAEVWWDGWGLSTDDERDAQRRPASVFTALSISTLRCHERLFSQHPWKLRASKLYAARGSSCWIARADGQVLGNFSNWVSY